jgi:molybdopterin synthase catalytic subunit
VVFSGTVRDHAADLGGVMRDDVQYLEYEAYDEHVVPVFSRIEAELRERWPHTGRVAILHRTGRLDLGAVSVVVGVSSPHRPEAFEAARFAIDTLKQSAPIWKRETWTGGSDWGTGAHDISTVGGSA